MNGSVQSNAVHYSLQFKKGQEVKNVNLKCHLTVYEIDSLTFLFSKYYDQSKHVPIRGLTFFNEFNKCVDEVKLIIAKENNQNEIKRLYSMLLKHDFMMQVPHFRKIMQFLQKYFKPIKTPDISYLSTKCNICSVNRLECLTCKINYLSDSITLFDREICKGWDIFLRPLFGLPLFLYMTLKSDYGEANNVFNAFDVMTNSFSLFFYNLLTDKSEQYVDKRACALIINECRKHTSSLEDKDLEYLLYTMKTKNISDMYVYVPFKQFIINLARKTNIKMTKMNRIAAVIFAGFFLRLYLDGASKRIREPLDLQIRNVCRVIVPNYTPEQFERFMSKIVNIKKDLSVEQYIITEKYISQLINRHKLDEDFSVIINDNV